MFALPALRFLAYGGSTRDTFLRLLATPLLVFFEDSELEETLLDTLDILLTETLFVFSNSLVFSSKSSSCASSNSAAMSTTRLSSLAVVSSSFLLPFPRFPLFFLDISSPSSLSSSF